MPKNREPLAVKLAKKVLNDQLVRSVEWKPEIVFEEDFENAIDREIDNLKPETLGRIIAYGAGYWDVEKRTSVRGGTDPSNTDFPYMNGTGWLKTLAMSVIRAAMMDLIEANNRRLTPEGKVYFSRADREMIDDARRRGREVRIEIARQWKGE